MFWKKLHRHNSVNRSHDNRSHDNRSHDGAAIDAPPARDNSWARLDTNSPRISQTEFFVLETDLRSAPFVTKLRNKELLSLRILVRKNLKALARCLEEQRRGLSTPRLNALNSVYDPPPTWRRFASVPFGGARVRGGDLDQVSGSARASGAGLRQSKVVSNA